MRPVLCAVALGRYSRQFPIESKEVAFSFKDDINGTINVPTSFYDASNSISADIHEVGHSISLDHPGPDIDTFRNGDPLDQLDTRVLPNDQGQKTL